MWIVAEDQVGSVAYARMLRDGVIMPVAPTVARPHDVAPDAAMRRTVLLDRLPTGSELGGLTALWALRGGRLPGVIDAVGPPGWHPRAWRGPFRARFHTSHRRGSSSSSSSSKCTTAQAIAQAFQWGPLGPAIATTHAVIRSASSDAGEGADERLVAGTDDSHRHGEQASWALISQIDRAIEQIAYRDPTRARALSAWAALRATMLAAPPLR